MRRPVLAAVTFVILAGACNGVGQEDSEGVPTTAGTPSLEDSQAENSSGSSAAPPGIGTEGDGPGDRPGGQAHRSSSKARPNALPPAAAEGASGSRPAAGETAYGQGSGTMRSKGTRVLEGNRGDVSWYVNAWEDGEATCLSLHSRGPAGGGGAESFTQRPPLGVSVQRAVEGRFAWGLTSSRVMQVRLDQYDGATETFATVEAVGFRERFYGGLIAPTPFARIVGLDSEGREVAEYDVRTLNQTPV